MPSGTQCKAGIQLKIVEHLDVVYFQHSAFYK